MACSLEDIKRDSLNEAKRVFKGNSKTIKIIDDTAYVPKTGKFKPDVAFKIALSNMDRVKKWAETKFKSSIFKEGWVTMDNSKSENIEVSFKFPNNLEQAYIKKEAEDKKIPVDRREFLADDALFEQEQREDLNLKKSTSSKSITDEVDLDIVKKAFSSFKNKLGINFNILTQEELEVKADEIHKKTGRPPKDFKGISGFYHSGSAYLSVDDPKLLSSGMHEFLHPIMQHLRANNPTKLSLFINNFKGTIEWTKTQQEVLSDSLYSEMSPDEVNEEVFIRLLEERVANEQLNKKYSSKFENFFKDVIFFFKQLLKSIIPNVGNKFTFEKKFNYNMSLEEFSKLIVNEHKIILDFDKIKQLNADEKVYLKSPLDGIKDNNKNIKLSQDGETYEDLSDGSKLTRLTNLVKSVFANNDKDLAEIFATKTFKDNGKDVALDKVKLTVDDKEVEYTYKELVEFNKKQFETAAVYGSIGHAIIERKIRAANGEDITEVNKRIKELSAAKPGKQNEINIYHLESHLKNSLDYYLSELGLTFNDPSIAEEQRDKLISEIVVHNKELGVATAVDGIVEHSNKTISLIDWKMGKKFLDDALNLDRILNYSKVSESIYNNKLGKAKLELALRALMLKAQNKDLKFNKLSIAHIDKIRGLRNYEVNLEEHLIVLERWIKVEHPSVYEQYKNDGLFNADTYFGLAPSAEQGFKDSETKNKDYIKDLKERIFRIQSKQIKSNIDKEDLMNLMGKLMEASKLVGENYTLDSDEDISFLKRWLTNKYGVSNKHLQSFYRHILDPAKERARKRIEAIHSEHDRLAKEVLKEYFKSKGSTYREDFISKHLNSLFTNYQDAFDFMWVHNQRMQNGDIGSFGRKNAIGLTKVQTEYFDFYRKSLTEVYEPNAKKKTVGDRGKDVTMSESLGLPEKLEDNFMPRVPLAAFERNIKSKNEGLDLKKIGANTYNKILSTISEDEIYFESKNPNIISFKYLGSPSVIASSNHTMNVEVAFKKFTSAMINKDELDEPLVIANGLKDYLGLKPSLDGMGKFYENTINYLEDHIWLEILNAKKSTKWTAKGLKLPVYRYNENTRKFEKDPNKFITLSIDKIMSSFKNLTSAIAMWFKPVGGTFNALLIVLMNLKEGIKNSTLKRLGVDDDKLSFTLSDLMWAHKDVMSYWGAGFANSKNKLKALENKFKFLPDNYDYIVDRSSLLTDKYKILNSSNFYIFHSIPEEYGQLILLSAQLRKMKNKKTGKSIWDSYDDDGNWIGGERFKQKDFSGKELSITELTTEEVTRLKRTTQIIHGGYRNDERTALEANALGQWAVQFKKYLPVVLETSWQSAYKDVSLGHWEEQKDGFAKWTPYNNIGRSRLLFKSIFSAKSLKENLTETELKDLSQRQKQAYTDLLTSLSLFTIILLLRGDDDDEEPALKFRLDGLQQNMTQVYNPWDWTDALKNGTPVITKLNQLGSNWFEYLVHGVARGERVKSGPNKGKRRGESKVTKGVPIFGGYLDLYSIGLLEDEDTPTRR